MIEESAQPSQSAMVAVEHPHLLARISLKLRWHREREQSLLQQSRIQAQREQALNQVIQAIRQSLELPVIFSATVSEVGKLLQTDQASIAQFFPERQIWINLAEHRRDRTTASLLEREIPDADNPVSAQLRQGQIVRIDNVEITCTDEINQHLAQQFPGSWLMIPLVVDNPPAQGRARCVWGMLGLIRHHAPHRWEDWEVNLMKDVADQLAIAIQQSQLYQQVQQLNATLEQQVEERTTQLQTALRSEDLLRRMTDRVRDSLDETQILQTAVRELAEALDAYACNTGVYDLQQATSTVSCEHIRSNLLPALGWKFFMADYAEIYDHLLSGQTVQCCQLNATTRAVHLQVQQVTLLACPMIDNQQVIGDLWLFKPVQEWFTETEIRLVQQFANQCAIALRQSRLYQTAQQQVRELERLNQLKDDFLNTLSHELRTPMANIRTATQMLETNLQNVGLLEDPQHPISRYFEILSQESQRELTLINNLLALSHLDADTEPLFLSTLNLSDWLADQIESFLEPTRQRQQQLMLKCKTPLSLTTDFVYLNQIIRELLTNAYKYTPSGGHITLAAYPVPGAQVEAPAYLTKTQKHDILLSVTNSGVEILPEEQHRIFDRFYRIPSSDPWKHEGTGLGLTLVKKLVRQLGGQITVSSGTNLTCFSVCLPNQVLKQQ